MKECANKLRTYLLIAFIYIVGTPYNSINVFALDPKYVGAVLTSSEKYKEIKEVMPNRSRQIDIFNKALGAPLGSSWCMSFVQFNYIDGFATYKLPSPLPKDARVSRVWKAAKKNPYRYKIVSAKRLALGIEKAELVDVVIWSNGKVSEDQNWPGHTGILLKQLSNSILLVREGNTSSGNKGSQSNGDGVYDRMRNLNIGKKFQIEGLIRIK